MATKKQNDEQATPATPVDENQTASGMENSGQEGAHGEAKASEVREAAPVPQENVATAPQKAAVTASREPPTGKTWWTWPCWLTATASRPGWRPPCAA